MSVALMGGTLVVVAISCLAIPVHISFGAGTLECGTVVSPDKSSEIAEYCGDAAAHHLRGTLVVGAVLAGLSLPPMAWSRVRRSRELSWVWLAVWLTVTAGALLWLAWAFEYSPPHAIFDL